MKEEIMKMIKYHTDLREMVKKEDLDIIEEMGGEQFFNHVDYIINHLALVYIEMCILMDFLKERFDDDSEGYN